MKKNIVLFTMDCVRRDALGLYGKGGVSCPNLERVASEGILVEDAWAQGPKTWISHASVFTGLWPFQHGVINATSELHDQLPTLAGILRDAGWATAGWPASIVVGKDAGFDSGFETWEERWVGNAGNWGQQYFGKAPGVFTSFVDFEDILSRFRAFRFAEENRIDPRPWFAWLHYFDVHYMDLHFFQSYIIGHPEFKSMLSMRNPKDYTAIRTQFYREKVAYMDHWIGQFLKLADPETTIVCFFSDHGEDFSGPYPDHDACTPGELRVPLIFWGGGLRPQRLAGPKRLLDIFPTLLNMSGIKGYRIMRDEYPDQEIGGGIDVREPYPIMRGNVALTGYSRRLDRPDSLIMSADCPRTFADEDEAKKHEAALKGLGYL